MNMKTSVLLVIVAMMCVSFAAAQTSTPFTYCAGWSAATSFIDVTTVTLNPAQPTVGTDEVVGLSGTINETFTGGSVQLDIYFGSTPSGSPVISNTYDACATPNVCPQGPGAISAQITVSGSTVVLPASFVGQATVKDSNGNPLVCVDVPFTVNL